MNYNQFRSNRTTQQSNMAESFCTLQTLCVSVTMRLECKSVVYIPHILMPFLSGKIKVLIPLVYPFSSKHTYRSSLPNFKDAPNLAYTQNPIIVRHSTYASFMSLQTAVTERSSLCGIVVNCFLSPSKKTSFHFKPMNLQPRYIVSQLTLSDFLKLNFQ
jgi:hypothetical protein